MMSVLFTLIGRSAVEEPKTLEQLMEELARYGSPRLGFYGQGWHANIDVNVNGVGAKLEVASEFGLPSPLAAADQCHKRLLAAIMRFAK